MICTAHGHAGAHADILAYVDSHLSKQLYDAPCQGPVRQRPKTKKQAPQGTCTDRERARVDARYDSDCMGMGTGEISPGEEAAASERDLPKHKGDVHPSPGPPFIPLPLPLILSCSFSSLAEHLFSHSARRSKTKLLRPSSRSGTSVSEAPRFSTPKIHAILTASSRGKSTRVHVTAALNKFNLGLQLSRYLGRWPFHHMAFTATTRAPNDWPTSSAHCPY